MKYLSACSGIEAASVAWRPLGWHAVGFSEINPFCCALLKHYYPEVPNHGDFRNIRADDVGPVDVLVAGTPCQSFSIAGLRAGLGDDRGNLSLAFLKLAQRIRPRWVVWENVPGVLSSLSHDAPDPCEPPPPMDLELDGQEVETGDEYDSEELHAFNCFVAGLSELGYGWAFRVFDAQHFGVPQRRRRVFVVGCLGDWRGAAAVLFESASLQGDIAARQAAGQDIAGSLGGGSGERGWCDDLDRSGAFIPSGDRLPGTDRGTAVPVSSFALNAHGGSGRMDGESETFVPVIAPCLTQNYGKQPDNSDTNVGPMLIAFDTTQISSKTNRSQPEAGDPCHPLTAAGDPPAIAFNARQDPDSGSVTHPLDTDGNSIGVAVPETLQHNGISHASTQEANARAALRILRDQVGEEAFAEWGLGVLDSLQPQKVLRPILHGKGFRFTDEPHSGVVHHALSCAACLSSGAVFCLWKAGSAGRPPQGWRPHEQLAIELGAYLSQLPYSPSPHEVYLRDLWSASEGVGLLLQALSTLQEVGRSSDSQGQSVRADPSGNRDERSEELCGSVLPGKASRERLLRNARPTDETWHAGNEQQDSQRRSTQSVANTSYAVRRLVPAEAEALQGFPRNYTLVPYRRKPAADGPRYRSLGNSMCVPVMRFIGERIELVEPIRTEQNHGKQNKD